GAPSTAPRQARGQGRPHRPAAVSARGPGGTAEGRLAVPFRDDQLLDHRVDHRGGADHLHRAAGRLLRRGRLQTFRTMSDIDTNDNPTDLHSDDDESRDTETPEVTGESAAPEAEESTEAAAPEAGEPETSEASDGETPEAEAEATGGEPETEETGDAEADAP